VSLASFAVRTCTIEALRGNTLVADEIIDSPIDPIDFAGSISAPTIAVFSEAERLTPQGRSFHMTRDDTPQDGHVLTLSMMIYLPSTPVVSLPGRPDLKIDALESGAAFVFDLVYRQMVRALTLLDGPWSALWRRAVVDIDTAEMGAFVLETGKGVRIPARQITLRLGVIDEPAFCGEAVPFWTDFVAALAASDDLADYAPIIADALAGGDLPKWRGTAALMGLSPDEAVAIGQGPVGGDSTDPIVPMMQVAVDDRAPVDPFGGLIIAP
jgi:hypothetical protein